MLRNCPHSGHRQAHDKCLWGLAQEGNKPKLPQWLFYTISDIVSILFLIISNIAVKPQKQQPLSLVSVLKTEWCKDHRFSHLIFILISHILTRQLKKSQHNYFHMAFPQRTSLKKCLSLIVDWGNQRVALKCKSNNLEFINYTAN